MVHRDNVSVSVSVRMTAVQTVYCQWYIVTTCWCLCLLGWRQQYRRCIVNDSMATYHYWWSSQHQESQKSNSSVRLSAVSSQSLGSHWNTHTQQPFGHVRTTQVVTSLWHLFTGYHTAVFISARISSPSVDNCPKHSWGHLSAEGLI